MLATRELESHLETFQSKALVKSAFAGADRCFAGTDGHLAGFRQGDSNTFPLCACWAGFVVVLVLLLVLCFHGIFLRW